MKTAVGETIPLYLTALSPLHIGAGEDYEPTNYVIDEGTLYAFGSEAASQALSPQQHDSLLAMVSGDKRRPEEMIKQVQAFFHAQRETLAAVAGHYLPAVSGVAELYGNRIGRDANRESKHRGVINRLEIERTFYNHHTQGVVIPGSSLKGALRTALLDGLNNNAGLEEDERHLLNDRKPFKKAQANSALQKRLFRGGFAADPMRLISIADSGLATIDGAGREVMFAVDRKKKAAFKDGKELEANAPYQLLECLSPLEYRRYQSSLGIQDLQGHGGKNTPANDLRWSVQELVAACNDFYYPRFKTELSLLRERGLVDTGWAAAMDTLMTGGVFARMQAGTACLLRVGRHSGAESVTLNGVRKIKIMQGKGQPPRFADAASTVWLAAQHEKAQNGLLPFGWVLLELDETPLTDELQAVMQDYTAPQRERHNAQQQRRKALQANWEVLRQQRAAEARQTELKQQQEAEAAAVLAAMSEQARERHKIEVMLAADREAGVKQAGGRTLAALAGLLQLAADWPQDEQVALADLAETVYGWHGWGPKKKRPAKMVVLETLRGK
ncbi:MAG: RAMP superfamily CRISPR-associated protein [Thiolinea sp.]